MVSNNNKSYISIFLTLGNYNPEGV